MMGGDMKTAADFLVTIETPWRRCLELAWAAYVAGSIPVGSVLTDENGAMVSEGRNRTEEHGTVSGVLSGTSIAHAEVNALARTRPGSYPNHTLWSSLEPCVMCTGAAMHARIGNIRYAAPELVITGIERIPTVIPWAKGRWATRTGLDGGPIADIANLLALSWRIPRSSRDDLDSVRTNDPLLLDVAAKHHNVGTLDRHRSDTFEIALESIWSDVIAVADRHPTGRSSHA